MGTLKLNTTSGGSLSIQAADGASDNTLTLPAVTGGNIVTTADSGTITQGMIGSGVVGKGPAFAGYSSNYQVISTGTFTKLQIDAEDFDTNSNYDHSTNYRFTPTVAGYYYFTGRVEVTTNPSATDQLLVLYKNGSSYAYIGQRTGNDVTRGIHGSILINANGSTDYFELYYYQATGGNLTIDIGTTPRRCQFSAFLVRAA